jgi:hypothetical protein
MASAHEPGEVPGVDQAAPIMTMTGARATADLVAEALS